MASKTIKGLTVQIGGDTTKLGKALQDVEAKSRSLSKELGDINKLLKLDPGNADLLAQKQQVLAEAVANTAKKLETLKEAERQVQEQFERGEVSEEQVRALQREIVATQNKLTGYENAAKQTADQIDNLGEAAEDAASGIDDVADSADDAEDSLDGFNAGLDSLITGGLKALVAAAAAAAAGLVASAEATREYRTALGKLDTAFQENGHSAETAQKTYKALQGVLGETDQAVEAANHLALLTDNEQDLEKWTDICTGVFATFGDSLPIEGLTEAANHTAKLGEVQGPLADALEWSGITADDFNEQLEKCSDEQERQQLITKTLSKIYGGAAKSYKETNKSVIEANEANEEWTATLAELGEEMEPVNTEFKKLGVAILKDASGPLKDLIGFVQDDVIPALYDIGRWTQQNLPAIASGLAGVTAAMVAYRVATLAAKAATEGVTVATLAAQAATKLLALAQAATPLGVVTVAVTGLVAAMAAYKIVNDEVTESTETLTKAEREQIEAAREAAAAHRDRMAAVTENEGKVLSEIAHTQTLAKELQTLVGANGAVQESDRARVEFILGQLNSALGTEYEMVNGVVQKYGDLKTSIYEVIAAKQANLLLEANSAAYTEALQNRNSAMQGLVLAEKDYQAQLAITKQKEQEYNDFLAYVEDAAANVRTEGDARALASLGYRLSAIQEEMEAEQKKLDGKKKAYDETAAAYGSHVTVINGYEEAQTAILEGNYQRAVEILTEKGQAFGEYSDKVDEETAKVLDTLYQEAVDAGIEADRMKTNFENGVEGYTEEMVKEAQISYEQAMSAYADAYTDAEGVGEDIGDGLADGMEKKRQSAIGKVRSIVSAIIAAAREAADSHSPSRKMIDFGEDMGEGAVIGMDNKTKALKRSGEQQAQAIMSAFDDAPEDAAQTVFHSLQAPRTSAPQPVSSAPAGMMDKLDLILQAIERGQVLTIDSKQLVGGTASMYDNALGQRRALAARGAL